MAHPSEQPAATRLESMDEIRKVLQARRAQLANKPATAQAQPAAEADEPDPEAYRPRLRPPMALLCVLDDGKADGEWHRLRGERCVLGRADGDLRIPHDAMMSGRHAEIVRQKTATGYRWLLVDLQSTNGTYVRVGSTVLRPQNELLIGSGHYRFEGAGADPAPAEPAARPPQTILGWSNEAVRLPTPALVELTGAGPGSRFPLTQSEAWIGRDRSCAIARPDDVLASARHARLYRDAKGQWHVENHKSLNGVWLRIEQVPVESACQFQLGEQRFLLRVQA